MCRLQFISVFMLCTFISTVADKLVNTSTINTSEYSRKLPPNYFVAVQIKNPNILQKLTRVQNSIEQRRPEFRSTFAPPNEAHVTLTIMRLDEFHCIHDATKALDNIVETLRQTKFRPVNVTFEGVGNFYNKVIIIHVKNDTEFQRLCSLSRTVRENFEMLNITSMDNRNFTPHLTVASMRKDPKLVKEGATFPSDLYQQFVREKFGTETINTIQLLGMDNEREKDGYYYIVKEIKFA